MPCRRPSRGLPAGPVPVAGSNPAGPVPGVGSSPAGPTRSSGGTGDGLLDGHEALLTLRAGRRTDGMSQGARDVLMAVGQDDDSYPQPSRAPATASTTAEGCSMWTMCPALST